MEGKSWQGSPARWIKRTRVQGQAQAQAQGHINYEHKIMNKWMHFLAQSYTKSIFENALLSSITENNYCEIFGEYIQMRRSALNIISLPNNQSITISTASTQPVPSQLSLSDLTPRSPFVVVHHSFVIRISRSENSRACMTRSNGFCEGKEFNST